MSHHQVSPPSSRHSGQRLLWEEGDQPGTRVVAGAIVAVASALALDAALLSGPGLLFTLVFVTTCAGAALLVRPGDFFAVGVLPPLLMLGLFAMLGAIRPGAIARSEDGVVQAVISGLSHHSIALVVGYALCLTVLGVRDRFVRGILRPGGMAPRDRRRHRDVGPDAPSVRTGPGHPPPPGAPPGHLATSRRRWSARQGSRLPR